jgi:hypothetical protein
MELGEKLIPQGDLTLAFTPFESLQESQVVNWLMAQFTVEEISQLMDAIKARLEQQVEATQPKYAEYLPWMAQDDPRNPRTTPANYVAITFPEVYDPSA